MLPFLHYFMLHTRRANLGVHLLCYSGYPALPCNVLGVEKTVEVEVLRSDVGEEEPFMHQYLERPGRTAK